MQKDVLYFKFLDSAEVYHSLATVIWSHEAKTVISATHEFNTILSFFHLSIFQVLQTTWTWELLSQTAVDKNKKVGLVNN